jgi:hypothetical protein
VILPQVTTWDMKAYIEKFNAKLVPQGFNYTSGDNTEWETVDSLRTLIKEHLYPDFSV